MLLSFFVVCFIRLPVVRSGVRFFSLWCKIREGRECDSCAVTLARFIQKCARAGLRRINKKNIFFRHGRVSFPIKWSQQRLAWWMLVRRKREWRQVEFSTGDKIANSIGFYVTLCFLFVPADIEAVRNGQWPETRQLKVIIHRWSWRIGLLCPWSRDLLSETKRSVLFGSQCYMYCLWEQFGLVDDKSELSLNGMLTFFQRIPAYRAEVQKAISECKGIGKYLGIYTYVYDASYIRPKLFLKIISFLTDNIDVYSLFPINYFCPSIRCIPISVC